MTDSFGPFLDYAATSFSQGRMDFQWEEPSAAETAAAYADWEAGRGLIGGNPHRRPDADRLPVWGVDRPFFRAFALDDPAGGNGARLRGELASTRPLEIEVGYGRGDFLLDRAVRRPQTLFLGYEAKTKATRLFLARLERFSVGNVWISDDDCRFNLPRLLPDRRAAAVHILFPDPWWKTGHKAKRLFSPPFVDLLAAKLAPGGLLHVKTDVAEYGAFVRYLVERHPAFGSYDPALAERVGEYVPTHREHWCRQHSRPFDAYFFARR